MANPKTVGRFYVDTSRQDAQAAESVQDSALRYMNEVAGIGSEYLSIWSNAQQLSLQTAFQLQNDVMEATQSVWDASTRANAALFEEWARAVAESQVSASRMVAAGVSMLDNPVRRKGG